MQYISTRGQAPVLEAIAGFLDREAAVDRPQHELMSRPTGAEFAALAEAWRAEVTAAAALHPICGTTRATVTPSSSSATAARGMSRATAHA